MLRRGGGAEFQRKINKMVVLISDLLAANRVFSRREIKQNKDFV